MNQIQSLQEIFEACCHVPEKEHTADTIISVSSGMVKTGQEISALPIKTIFYKINMRFMKSDDYIIVDLQFANHMDAKLNRVLSLLNEYQDQCDMLDETEYPQFHLSLLPSVLKGEYHIVFANPVMFALHADKPSKYPSILRILFEDENVVILQNNDIDYAALLAEAKRKADMEAFYQAEEEKKRKRDAYEAEHQFNRAEYRR